MNPVLMLCRNSLALTIKAMESVLNQDIEVTPYIIDNDSTDGTAEWLKGVNTVVRSLRFTPAKGVSASWNFGLSYLFDVAQCDHVLVVNNDVQLRPDTYRELIDARADFVTAVGVGDPAQLEWDHVHRMRPHPDFSCFLIDKSVWRTVGQFDESMVHYASDADYHLRMHQAGIKAYTNGIPFYHYASGTLKTATETERQQIHWQADRDRETFERKWGVKIGSPDYYAMFDVHPASVPSDQAHE